MILEAVGQEENPNPDATACRLMTQSGSLKSICLFVAQRCGKSGHAKVIYSFRAFNAARGVKATTNQEKRKDETRLVVCEEGAT